MDESFVKNAFSPERAAIYDQQFVGVSAIKDLMHLYLRVHFKELPNDAKILVVGAGTGAEVRFLAPLFPNWRFTLVDPAEGMLSIARRHAEAEGFADRCTFQVGYVSDCPDNQHDAATSILVSHFLTDGSERRRYFADIAKLLKPGGLFFNADLAADPQSSSFEPEMQFWLKMMEHAHEQSDAPRFLPSTDDSDSTQDSPPSYREMFGKVFAAHTPAEVTTFLEQAGFRKPMMCYQAVLIRAWLTRLAQPA